MPVQPITYPNLKIKNILLLKVYYATCIRVLKKKLAFKDLTPSLLIFIVLGWLFIDSGYAAENRITHGPILGRPGSRSMGVWARTARPGTFTVLYGRNKQTLNQATQPVRTTLAKDNTGWVLLEPLLPNTLYYYAVAAADETPPPDKTGYFRTLPEPDLFRAVGRNPKGLFNFSFEIGCGNLLKEGRCADPQLGLFDVALNKLGDKIHFAVQTGDFIYEDNKARMLMPEQWVEEMGLSTRDIPGRIRIAPRLVGVWENYKRYLDKSPPLSRWHRHIPGWFMLDDHEILNDVQGTGEIGFRGRAACFRDMGVQAWEDYVGWANPVRFNQGIWFGKATLDQGSDILTDKEADFTSLDPSQAATLLVHWGTGSEGTLNPRLDRNPRPGDPNAGVYEIRDILDQHRLRISPPARHGGRSSYSIGRRNYFKTRVSNVAFFFVDTRSHRGLPAMNFKKVKDQTMLGTQQKNWLKESMAQSDADFLLVISSVNLMIPHKGKGGIIRSRESNDEAWTGFIEEREELIRFWETLNKPVLILSGDLHNSFAIKLSDKIWEFGAAPHNSLNHNLKSEGERPINGTFMSGPRECSIRWSTFFLNDTAPERRKQPVYTVVNVNNVFNNPMGNGAPSWVAYPHPQITVQFYNGFNGDLLYSESIVAGLQH